MSLTVKTGRPQVFIYVIRGKGTNNLQISKFADW